MGREGKGENWQDLKMDNPDKNYRFTEPKEGGRPKKAFAKMIYPLPPQSNLHFLLLFLLFFTSRALATAESPSLLTTRVLEQHTPSFTTWQKLPLQNFRRQSRKLLNENSPFAFVNKSTCIQEGLGQIIINKDSDCKAAAIQIMQETYNITLEDSNSNGLKDSIFDTRYSTTEPSGCYVLNKTKIFWNQNLKEDDGRPECSTSLVCVCQSCNPGMYRDEEAKDITKCTSCPAGYQNSNMGSVVCNECTNPGGGATKMYSVAGASSCAYSSCPAGTEIDASRDSSLACYVCPGGKYNMVDPALGGTKGRCKFCKGGYKFTTTTTGCDECIAGMYQDQDRAEMRGAGLLQKCKLCMSGFSSVRGSQFCDYNALTCPPGTESDGGACLDCLGGKFTSLEGSTDCGYCTRGKSFTTPSTECAWCAAGQYQNQVGQPGINCSSCPNGTASTDNTATDYTCKFNRTHCPPGHYHDGGFRCLRCEIGRVRVDWGGKKEDDCIKCTKGFEYVDTISACTACPFGKYQDQYMYQPDIVTCKECEAGKASSKDDKGRAAIPCEDCEIGMYQDGIVASEQWGCRHCAQGHGYVDTDVSCVACQRGQIQPRNDVLSATCSDCEKGKYVVQEMSTECYFCKRGKEFTSISTNCASCLDVSVQDDNETAGAICKICPAGFTFVASNEVCSTCPPGRWDVLGFDDRTKTVQERDCKICAEGSSSEHWRESCTNCTVGMFQEDNKSVVWGCKYCASGTEYADVRSACTECAFGKYQSEDATKPSPLCKFCAKGKEFVTKKIPCAICYNGTYQELDDLANAQCLTCPKGRDAPDNKNTCVDCVAGKYQPFDHSVTYECRYCVNFQKAIQSFVIESGSEEWPPNVLDPWPFEWNEVGNFSLPGASYCPYFTLQQGRCDDSTGGVYIFDNKTCQQGATAIGWNKGTENSAPWSYLEDGVIFPNQNKYPLGCFDQERDFVNQFLYLDNIFTGSVGQMDHKEDCNMEENELGLPGRCICETCSPGKYKARMACGDTGGYNPSGCVLEKDKTKEHYYTAYKCRRCDVGMYQDEIGRDECKVCEAGRYQEKVWNDYIGSPTLACRVCPTGYVPLKPMASTCMSCDVGLFFDQIDVPCKECASGQYQRFESQPFEEDDEKDFASIQCRLCKPGKAPLDSMTACEICTKGRYQEKKIADVFGCKTCPAGYEHVGKNVPCSMCEIGRYQDRFDLENSLCKACSFGKDAVNKETPCLNCATGRFQNLDVSLTYGCTKAVAACKEEDGASLVEGKDVEPGKLTVRLYKGTCCQGQALTSEVLYLERCGLSNMGSSWVSFEFF